MCSYLENINGYTTSRWTTSNKLISNFIKLTLSLCSSRCTWCANIWSLFIKRGIFIQRNEASREEKKLKGQPRPFPSPLIKSCPLRSYNPINHGQQQLSQLCSPVCFFAEGRRVIIRTLRQAIAIAWNILIHNVSWNDHFWSFCERNTD